MTSWGDEPADGAAGVHADDDAAGGVEDEPGGLQVARVRVDEGARQSGHRGGVGAVADRKGEAVLADQFGGRGLVVDRERDHADVGLGESAAGALEGPQLRVAVRAP